MKEIQPYSDQKITDSSNVAKYFREDETIDVALDSVTHNPYQS